MCGGGGGVPLIAGLVGVPVPPSPAAVSRQAQGGEPRGKKRAQAAQASGSIFGDTILTSGLGLTTPGFGANKTLLGA